MNKLLKKKKKMNQAQTNRIKITEREAQHTGKSLTHLRKNLLYIRIK